MDAFLAYIHTEFILTGACGGFVHGLHERQTDPREILRYMLAAALLPNFTVPLVLVITGLPESTASGICFALGYGVFRVCRLADRYFDGKMKNPFKGPTHD
jgi:hypothetical protein